MAQPSANKERIPYYSSRSGRKRLPSPKSPRFARSFSIESILITLGQKNAIDSSDITGPSKFPLFALSYEERKGSMCVSGPI
ncbi:homoserine O-acetyltransferase [Aspergillus luchuensis]|uniref:Homoserine O-acetyltransferase n=1 Tax=Aspergillus kawachii TaxID=1069201 RepID=A0A146F6B3_ASPKA|nr:homoserine O-acetyltransferase [Aspergillus luchuensis]